MKITGAVTYIASSIPGKGEMLRQVADKRVAEIVGAKVAALVEVNHELSPALPRDLCHFKPHREYMASAEVFVFTRTELEKLLNDAKGADIVF